MVNQGFYIFLKRNIKKIILENKYLLENLIHLKIYLYLTKILVAILIKEN